MRRATLSIGFDATESRYSSGKSASRVVNGYFDVLNISKRSYHTQLCAALLRGQASIRARHGGNPKFKRSEKSEFQIAAEVFAWIALQRDRWHFCQ